MMGDGDEAHTKIGLESLMELYNVFHTLGMEKVENFEINFKNVDSQMVIMPLPDLIPLGSIADEA
jgi:hypothetical protein